MAYLRPGLERVGSLAVDSRIHRARIHLLSEVHAGAACPSVRPYRTRLYIETSTSVARYQTENLPKRSTIYSSSHLIMRYSAVHQSATAAAAAGNREAVSVGVRT